LDTIKPSSQISPVVEAALEQRQGERVEDALCAESDRMMAANHAGPSTGLDRLTDGVLLVRRAAGPTVGDEFAITRELARRRRREIEHSLDVLKGLKSRGERSTGRH
jgi:hypothetical protein